MDVDVRPAVAGDWTGLWPLLVGMGVPTGEDEASVSGRFAAMVRDPSWCLPVAFEEPSVGGLVGYAAAQDFGAPLRSGAAGHVARLHDLYVSPSTRQAGVGAALLGAVVEWASGRVRYLQWQAHETEAAPFYERLGHVGSPCPQPEYPEFEIAF